MIKKEESILSSTVSPKIIDAPNSLKLKVKYTDTLAPAETCFLIFAIF